MDRLYVRGVCRIFSEEQDQTLLDSTSIKETLEVSVGRFPYWPKIEPQHSTLSACRLKGAFFFCRLRCWVLREDVRENAAIRFSLSLLCAESAGTTRDGWFDERVNRWSNHDVQHAVQHAWTIMQSLRCESELGSRTIIHKTPLSFILICIALVGGASSSTCLSSYWTHGWSGEGSSGSSVGHEACSGTLDKCKYAREREEWRKQGILIACRLRVIMSFRLIRSREVAKHGLICDGALEITSKILSEPQEGPLEGPFFQFWGWFFSGWRLGTADAFRNVAVCCSRLMDPVQPSAASARNFSRGYHVESFGEKIKNCAQNDIGEFHLSRIRNQPWCPRTLPSACPLSVPLRGPLEGKSSTRLCNKNTVFMRKWY